jgi:hypothetical protein
MSQIAVSVISNTANFADRIGEVFTKMKPVVRNGMVARPTLMSGSKTPKQAFESSNNS